MKKHTFSILVRNEAGVLSRIANLFSARGFNIESLTVATTLDDDLSRVTMTSFASEAIAEQIMKQLNSLIDTLKIVKLDPEDRIERELVLCKVGVNNNNRNEVLTLVEMIGGSIVDVDKNIYTFQAVGTENQIASFIQSMRPFGIKELVRSGKVVLSKNETL